MTISKAAFVSCFFILNSFSAYAQDESLPEGVRLSCQGQGGLQIEVKTSWRTGLYATVVVSRDRQIVLVFPALGRDNDNESVPYWFQSTQPDVTFDLSKRGSDWTVSLLSSSLSNSGEIQCRDANDGYSSGPRRYNPCVHRNCHGS